jgi:hypothetical protein
MADQDKKALSVWEYTIGYAPKDEPHKVTFYDYHDRALYRDIPLDVIGQHGWEMVTVLLSRDPGSGQPRYEYFFKRDQTCGFEQGFSKDEMN